MTKQKKITLFTVIFLVIACICLTPKTLQNDTFYLIKIGEDILARGLDFKDHFTYVADLSYTYPHFLYNIFLALVYRIAGFTGVYISTIFFYIVFALSLFYILKKLATTSPLPPKTPKLTVQALNLLPSLLTFSQLFCSHLQLLLVLKSSHTLFLSGKFIS